MSETQIDAEKSQSQPVAEVNLLTPVNVREICDALQIHPTKTLGQNFVHDGGTVRKIITAGRVTAGEHVLEIGPGLGSLTLGLLEAGARVTAIEIDPVLATALPATVTAQGNSELPLRVLHKDGLEVSELAQLDEAPLINGTYAQWEAPTRLVANLPYNVAVPLVLSFLENFPSLTEILVMVQTEVAQRLSAGPGGRIYGVPSVKTAWYGKAEMAGTISRQIFWPVPNVDSSLVRITRYQAGEEPYSLDAAGAPTVAREIVFKLIEAAFAQRRKTLRAAFKNWLNSAEKAELLLESAGIDGQRRGETLNITEFIALGESAQKLSLLN
ncbi:16S rRNA (adenine(1518)-N(6)/adenine(1519)-N(6))-dimethyltransferase RsmA [Gleimia sp. 6138-11-ORH1]|uniref:16S rRNA (adenine(1518)-N(6)/adenine(1519)-N(6))- dimethyltransferase RsmA n=1 Tax=Gleimia sp. 6138-11-ORH1 TaxID=2973937 RepID=UPI002166E721|nr:16S rRNA (adenine(1518)-N(6)/adenine(1519)-N(6))-dimethyltransferase RsmA [Gleimia sp. 6138-11-ORH1]MCS4483945.1 16S rRNA (adenine(1518)-N(6)/adenine(1519)-N(6))-dimethyltransferase RsmA [Gleimia sp. 6138-11-ORH1]